MEWYSCSYSGGNLDSLLDTHGVSPEVQTFRADRGLPFSGSVDNPETASMAEFAMSHKSGFYTILLNDIWYNFLNLRHRNGYGDGSGYGIFFYSRMLGKTAPDIDLVWRQQTGANSWGLEKILLDSNNYKRIVFNNEWGNEINLIGNISNIKSDYVWINYRDKITDTGTSKPIQKYILGNGAAGRAALECKYLLINDRPGDASLADTTFLVSWLNGVLKSVNRADFIQAKMTNGYYGMCFGNYQDNGWIRTTQSGLLPYQQGGVGSGHCQLGTNTWSFLKSYIDTMVTHKIMFNDTIALIQAFDDGDGQDNGCELVVTGAGNTFIGAGEAPISLRTTLQAGVGSGEAYSKVAENLYVASDGNIYFYSNCNTIGNRRGIMFDTSGCFRPLKNNAMKIGSPSYSFFDIYGYDIHCTFINGVDKIVSSNSSSIYNIPRMKFSADRIDIQKTESGSSNIVIGSVNCFMLVTSAQHFPIGFHPSSNNVGTLGSSLYKWNQVWATNGTIQTSDQHEKKEISYIGTQTAYDTSMSDETLVKFVRGLGAVVYKRKNGESGRPHHGFIAQDVEALMQEVGIKDHAAFIKSPVTETKEWDEEVENEDGTIETVRKTEQIDTGEVTYGLRYEEFIADIVRFIQLQDEKIEEQERKINSLEGRLSALENMLNPSQD